MASNKNKYQYYVVEFSNTPYEDFDRYVCVPNTWIVLRDDRSVYIRYPIEKLSKTKKRVKKKEERSDNWLIFVASVIYGTDSYKDAKNKITLLDNKTTQGRSYAEVANDADTEPSVLEVQAHESEPILLRLNKPETSETAGTPANKTVSKKYRKAKPYLKTNPYLSNNPYSKSYKKTTEILKTTEMGKTSNSASKSRRYNTRQSRRLSQFSRNEQSSSTCASYLNQNTEEKSEKISKDCETETSENKSQVYVEKNPNSIECNDKESSVNHDTAELSNEILNSEICREPIFGADFPDLLKELHSRLEITHIMFDRLRHEYLDKCTMIKEMIKLVEKYNNLYSDLITTTSDEMATVVIEEKEDKGKEVEKVTDVDMRKTAVKRKLAEKNQNENEDDDHDEEDKRKEVSPKKRGHSREFTLPPDYDPNDTRWTLRYREKMDGLVELMPYSRVYVNAIRLSNCKRLSKDSKTLGRMLLMEVFTESALSTCSLTGKNANAFDGKTVKPGLDENARIVLLNFVEQHASDNKWVKLDTQSVLNSLRHKMQEMRGRYR